MTDFRIWIVAGIAFWIGGGLQENAALRLGVFGVVPDYLLTVSIVLSLYSNGRTGMVFGFLGGALTGALVGANLWQYVTSRMAVGGAAGWLADQKVQLNPFLGLLTVALGTLVGQLILMFFAPPPAILPFITATIGSAIYNGVVATLLCLVLDRLGIARSR